MKFFIQWMLIFVGCSAVIGQGNDIIKITSERNENIIKIYAENTGTESYNVILNITSTGFKHTRECPMEETIASGEKKYMTSLIAKKDEAANYSVSMQYTPTHPKAGQRIPQTASEMTNVDLSKGIFVFSKDGCGRCKHVEKFMADHNITYKKFNISRNPGDASLMWSELSKVGYQRSTVGTPVIIVDGKVHYDVDTYNDLLKQLANGH